MGEGPPEQRAVGIEDAHEFRLRVVFLMIMSQALVIDGEAAAGAVPDDEAAAAVFIVAHGGVAGLAVGAAEEVGVQAIAAAFGAMAADAFIQKSIAAGAAQARAGQHGPAEDGEGDAEQGGDVPREVFLEQGFIQ